MRIIKATLLKRSTDDGAWTLPDTWALGETVGIDLDSIRTFEAFGPHLAVRMAGTTVELTGGLEADAWIALELLQVSES